VVRKDLSPSQRAVQATHAALKAAKQFSLKWNEHPHLVICEVDSLEHLLRCSESLSVHGVQHCVWSEPDLNNEPASLATTLISGAARRHLRKFPLLNLGSPVMENVAIICAVEADSHQSRWGNHPCDHATYLKLKQVHKAFWASIRKQAANERWNAKTVHCSGPEPKYCKAFSVPKTYGSHQGKYGMFRRTDLHPLRVLFQAARTPSEQSVAPFDAETLSQIDAWLVVSTTKFA
jgi:hypothetical protein